MAEGSRRDADAAAFQETVGVKEVGVVDERINQRDDPQHEDDGVTQHLERFHECE